MGYNTTVVVMNDALGQIESDPSFGKKFAKAIRSMQEGNGQRIDISAGNHANAAHVVETHHADSTVVVTVGGNLGVARTRAYGWGGDDELQLKLVRQWAKELGYEVVEPPKPKDLPKDSIAPLPPTLKKLIKTDFNTLAFVDENSDVLVTGFLTSENTIDQYVPDADAEASKETIPHGYGFEIVPAGDGCTAWSQDFTYTDEESGQEKTVSVLVTDSSGTTHKAAPSDELIIRVVDAKTGEGIMEWTQDNFPLDPDANLPRAPGGTDRTPGEPKPKGY